MPASLCARRASARVRARALARVPAYVDSERFVGWRILDERFHALDKRIALGDVEVRPILKRRIALTSCGTSTPKERTHSHPIHEAVL